MSEALESVTAQRSQHSSTSLAFESTPNEDINFLEMHIAHCSDIQVRVNARSTLSTKNLLQFLFNLTLKYFLFDHYFSSPIILPL